MPGSDLYLHRNTCSLTALALSPSVIFRFILFSVKIISTWLLEISKMVNTHSLQQKYKPHFEFPRNSVPRLHKVDYRNWHYGSRGRGARLTYVPLKTPNWAYSGLENKQTASLEIFTIVFLLLKCLYFACIFICWKFRCTKYTQIVQVDRSGLPSWQTLPMERGCR